MRFDTLPTWARTALKSAPVFGSDTDDATGGAATGAPAGAGTGEPPADKPEADKPIVVDPDEHVRLVQENQKKDAELAALQKEKTEREEAEEAAKAATRSKEENLEKENATLKQDVQNLTLVNTENLIELAILKNEKYQWIKPTQVAKLIDRTGIKIDPKTGKVEGVDEALKSLAKENAHLLKKADDGGTPAGGPTPGLPGVPSGGTPVGAGGDSSAKANKHAALIQRFGNVLTR